jgi:hypothetical protein
VGTLGTSWSGWTQTALAALGPEGLATMVPNMSGADGHESSVRHGGALELRFLAWAFWHSAYNTQAAPTAPPHVQAALDQGAARFSDWLERMPIRPGQTQLALVPPYEKWALEILTRADYDDYWKHPSMDFRRHWDRVPDMQILLVGGWYDSYTRATFQNFVGLGAGGRRPVRALMGPWTHTGARPWISPTRATWSSATTPRCRASTRGTCAGATGGCAAWATAWMGRRRCAPS